MKLDTVGLRLGRKVCHETTCTEEDISFAYGHTPTFFL
jgi:hypothetical protein